MAIDERTRAAVATRARYRCEYCLLPEGRIPLQFEVEHIIPIQHGGRDDLDNLAYSCRRCNRFKGPNLASIDQETGLLTRLYNPRLDIWSEHFAMIGAAIQPRTGVGRVTAHLMNLNEPMRLELRASLIEEGQFGP